VFSPKTPLARKAPDVPWNPFRLAPVVTPELRALVLSALFEAPRTKEPPVAA